MGAVTAEVMRVRTKEFALKVIRLTRTLPKTEEAKPKQIDVNVS